MTIYKAQNIKAFMNALLKSDVFDKFELREININTFASFSINGKKYDDEETKYCLWEEIKPYAFEAIKGNRLPRLIKIIFSPDPENVPGVNGASALFLNITYENDSISCITGISMKNFSLDRSAEYTFDAYIAEFFSNNNISVSTQAY